MQDFIVNLFSDRAFIPHGHCYLWQPGLVWLHIISDGMIALAYYSIPITLFYFVRKRQDLPFSQIFLLFAAFIIFCGTTHIAEIWTLWHPTYWLSGILKAATAIVSLFTAMELVPLVPQALALPSPLELREANWALQAQITERLEVENQLRRLQEELEERVQDRTAQLVKVNQQLQQEIDDRKLAQAALLQSEARFQKIAAASPAQIYILAYYPNKNEMRYEYISSGVREIQELEPQEVLTDALLTYQQVHPDDLLLYNQLTSQSLKTLQAFAHEWRIITPSGKMKWVRANSRPERRENGEIAWYGVLLDITDLKQAELALRESEERFRHAFYDAPIGMALLGIDQRWLQINPVLGEMLGYSELEFFSLSLFALVHSEDVDQLRQSIEQVLNNKNRSVQVQLRYLCNGGRVTWGLTSLSLVQDFQNQPLYYVLQIQDITEQQAIEQIKNEFISIVSHELRTPLTAIQGFLGLLNTGIYDNKPEKAKRMIQQASTNSDRLVRLVNDILDLERLSSGRVQLVKEVCNATDLIYRAVEQVQPIIFTAAITISMIPTTTCVWADPDLIIQTLTNLLSNAIKFSPHNSVITLSAQPQADWVLFQVQDQGRGIPADKLETIFERFEQVDVSDARAKGGTGLGLAICQSIIQQHGGSIWVNSTLGEGSTFYFTLPIAVS
ncbi:PAS domain S-box protein [Nostoc sp. LEGE 06077]|uniref:PAS domain-containing sensor histidine kinase n=1 Tax=Nostoc sp. LEGE 06077 TaxID=915325 RepID=UPI0018802FB5|nr:ATP-binding protein [Nostoc sp. LEGE 06077]MBE9206326.1 PAS domain S-box protein [Nostoc sp. LEGE 06077]